MTDNKMEAKVCRYNKTGYCKLSKECKFLHNNEICQGGCEYKKCTKRHPKTCRYQTNCRIKDKCAYKHESSSPDEGLVDQIELLNDFIKDLQHENKSINAKVLSLEKELGMMKLKFESTGEKNHVESKDKTDIKEKKEKKAKKVGKKENVKENNSVMKTPTDLIDIDNVMSKVDKAAQSETAVMCKLCQAELANSPELLVEHCRVHHSGQTRASRAAKRQELQT